MSSFTGYADDTDFDTDEFIELKTLPYPGRTRRKDQNMSTPQKRKGGLKERIFGTRRVSGSNGNKQGSSKFDVVRGVEGLQYTKKLSDSYESKELKKESYLPVKTAFKNGHKFEHHNKPTWCDVCEDFIWGLYTQALRCQYCRYTCHAKCVSYVDLDCPKAPSTEKSREELTKETLLILSDVTDGAATIARKNNNLPHFVSSISELRKLIKEFNDNSSLIMTLHDDYTFDGFIRVHMNLTRPVNVSSDVSQLTMKKAVARTKSINRKPISEIFDIDTVGHSGFATMKSTSGDSGYASSASFVSSESATMVPSGRRGGRKSSRRLSFYMPRGTYKPLHVTSQTTSREVIEALLAKYNVTDNPQKFALYEKYEKDDGRSEKEVIYKRIPDDEKPLVSCLSWGVNKEMSKSFALKENEDGKVQWEHFQTPELHNFLTILQLEEDELLAQILQKYENYKEALQRAMESKQLEVNVSYT